MDRASRLNIFERHTQINACVLFSSLDQNGSARKHLEHNLRRNLKDSYKVKHVVIMWRRLFVAVCLNDCILSLSPAAVQKRNGVSARDETTNTQPSPLKWTVRIWLRKKDRFSVKRRKQFIIRMFTGQLFTSTRKHFEQEIKVYILQQSLETYYAAELTKWAQSGVQICIHRCHIHGLGNLCHVQTEKF